MSEKYSVDDILNEVRRKREEKGLISVKPEIASAEEVFEKLKTEILRKAPETENEIPEKPVFPEKVEIPEKPEAAKDDVKEYVTGFEDTKSEGKKSEEAKPESYDYQPTVHFDKAAFSENKPSSGVDISIRPDGGFSVETPKENELIRESTPEDVVPTVKSENGKLSKTRLLDMKTEELSALGENSDKAEAWETFVRLTEDRNEDKNGQVLSQEIDDYSEKEDERSIRYDIKSLRAKVALRFWVCVIFSGLTGVMSAVKAGLIGTVPDEFEVIYLPAMFIFTFLPVIFCASTVFGGLWSLVKMKPDGDSPIGLAMLSILVFNGIMIFNSGNTEGLFLYNTIGILGLAFNAWGKLCVLKRALYNFGYLTADGDKYAIAEMDENLSQKLSRVFGDETPAYILCSKKVGFLTEFLNYSYSEDSADKSVRLTGVISLLISVAAGVASYFLSSTPDIMQSFGIFVLATVVTSPFGQYFGTNIPLLKASKKALKHGGMISGFASVEDLNNTDAITVDSDELFPDGSIVLHGIKTFEGQRIDEAILDAASVVVAAGTTLKSVFSDIIDDKRELLKPVDSLVYEDSMGVSGWVDSKRVLIGNRTLMENHNLIVPSSDYESKYLGEGNSAIYLANSGTLTAMFVVSYTKDKETANALYSLEKCGVKVLVRTTDPNITAEKLSEIFETDKDLFGIIPSALHKDCKDAVAAITHCSATAAHTGRFPAYAHVVSAAINSRKAIGTSGFFSSAFLILSYILVGLVAIMGTDATRVNVISVLLYQLIVLVFSSFLPSVRRY